MALKPVVPEYKAVETAWGKLINQKDAYKFGVRHIAAFSANLFQLMRIIEPDWESPACHSQRIYCACHN